MGKPRTGSRVFWEGVALLVGTIIGTGYLVLPYSFLKAGVAINVFWLAFFAVLVTILHLMYAEVVLGTSEEHRLPGYVRTYLGNAAAGIESISFVAGVFMTLLVYLLLGVNFLGKLVAPFVHAPQWLLFMIFWAALSVLLFVDFRTSSKIDLAVTAITFVFFIAVAVVAFAHGDAANLSLAPSESIFFPYGLILYALVGPLAIPEVIRLLRIEKRPERDVRRITITGSLLTAGVYLLFGLGVFIACGSQTTPDAVTGLMGKIPVWLLYTVVLMAFLEIANSYFIFEVVTMQTLRKDFGISKTVSLALTMALPIVFAFMGTNDFVKLMGFSGAVFLTVDAVFTVLMYRRLKRVNPGYQYQVLSLPRWVPALMVIVFLAGSAASLLGGR